MIPMNKYNNLITISLLFSFIQLSESSDESILTCCECITPLIQCPDFACIDIICSPQVDPTCCSVSWNIECAEASQRICAATNTTTETETERATTTSPTNIGDLKLCCACSQTIKSQITNGCDIDELCEDIICDYDQYCCQFEWDKSCALKATDICNNNYSNPSTTIQPIHTTNVPTIAPDIGLCCVINQECKDIICNMDNYCCRFEWDSKCDSTAQDICTTSNKTPPLPSTRYPTAIPTPKPTIKTSDVTTLDPTQRVTNKPTQSPINTPTIIPSIYPTGTPSVSPNIAPIPSPSKSPSNVPTTNPSISPTINPTNIPTPEPTTKPSDSTAGISDSNTATSNAPITDPTVHPTVNPTQIPSTNPITTQHTQSPTRLPTAYPTLNPSNTPTTNPSINILSVSPTQNPAFTPSDSSIATTINPTNIATTYPSQSPVNIPLVFTTQNPSHVPIHNPTIIPSKSPTKSVTDIPTQIFSPPSTSPATFLTITPTQNPVNLETKQPSENITPLPTQETFFNPCCDCIQASPFKGCSQGNGHECEELICNMDGYCCQKKWDLFCAVKSEAICKEIKIRKCCDCTVNEDNNEGCNTDQQCEDEICNVDPYCCSVYWDNKCIEQAVHICKGIRNYKRERTKYTGKKRKKKKNKKKNRKKKGKKRNKSHRHKK